MITYIKKLIIKRKQRKEIKLIINYIKLAKKYYIEHINNHMYTGMCVTFNRASWHKLYYNKNISSKSIPEFNAKYLNGDSDEVYWWPIKYTKVRLEAYDKLINLYKTKLKELC